MKLKEHLVNRERDSAGETIIFQNQTKNGFMHTMHRYSEIRMEHILTQRTFAPVLSHKQKRWTGRWKKTKSKNCNTKPIECVYVLCLNRH